jgi:hypothetical protein
MRAAAFALALAGLGACSFDFGFGGTRYQCGAGERCPDGQACVAGFCEAASDGGDDPDAAPAGPCGNLSLLQDSFDVAGVGSNWYDFADTGSSIAESGGQLVINVNANVNAYAGYIGRYLYDLHGAWYEGEVSAVFPSGSNTILEVRNYLGNVIQIVHQNGMIAAATYNAPDAQTYAERPWDPAERFWRIGEEDGDLVWQVSTDGDTWTDLHRRAPPFEIDHVRGAIAGGGTGPDAAVARFDGVNPDTPTSPYCTAAQLTDDFAAPPLEPVWDFYDDTGCTISEAAGNLVYDYSVGTGSAFCGISSYGLFDLSQSDGVVIDSAGLPTMANFISYLQMTSPSRGNQARIETTLDGSTIEYRLWVDDTITDSRQLLIDRVMHRYWRTRAEGQTAIFETSPDRAPGSWTERWRVSTPFPLSPVEVSFGAGHYDDVTLPLSVTLPGINAD